MGVSLMIPGMENYKPGAHDTCNTEYNRSIGRNSIYVRQRLIAVYWYTKVFECDLCHRLGSPRRIQERSDCYDNEWGTPTLCMGCWNKLRPIVKALNELRELGRLARLLGRMKPDAKH